MDNQYASENITVNSYIMFLGSQNKKHWRFWQKDINLFRRSSFWWWNSGDIFWSSLY
jgi:hypothetical protein